MRKGRFMTDDEYRRIVETYGDIVYRVALSYSKSAQDAEDVLQNTFMKLLLKNPVLKSEEHLRNWLIRVAVNECKDLAFSFWRKKVDLLEEEKQEITFDSAAEIDLYDALTQLPRKYRIIIHLFYYEGYTTKEIAGILHIRETAVRTRLVRARKQLKQMLKEEWENE